MLNKAFVLLCFRSHMLEKHWFYDVFAKHVEKHLVLLCFRSKILKKHWFYCVFAQKLRKISGFTLFSLTYVEKALVLLCFRSKMWKKTVFMALDPDMGGRDAGHP